jgi:anaerobic selenocysteine-containing dehydrogenase
MSTTSVRSICFECHSRCGVTLEVQNNKLIGVKGDPDHPHSHGYTCPKVGAAPEMIYYPDYAHNSCILLWAHNPEASWPWLYMHDINEDLKKGAKLIDGCEGPDTDTMMKPDKENHHEHA